MALDYKYLEGSKNIKNVYDCVKHNIEFNKAHPQYFHPEGITIFSGSQGEGKSLSAVQLVKNILMEYPKAIFCTNLEVSGIYNRTVEFTGLDCLETVNNGEYGVVYLIDEIQNYLNSLLSKNVPMSTIVSLTQQRKQRKIIIATSQVYGRMAKPLREQVKNVVLCKKILSFIQYNQLIDSMETEEINGKLVTKPKRRIWWFHSPALYNSYDTYKKQYGLVAPSPNNITILNTLDNPNSVINQ